MYGIKYRCEFDPIADVASTFLIEIYQKDYSGELLQATASTTPVVHQWETDDPKAPVKGCSLALNLINDGFLPLTSFFSTDDDAFKIVFSNSQSYTYNDTANISVVPGIQGQTKITINKPLSDIIINQASDIVINGVKYSIVSISKDSVQTYITTYGTPVMNAETPFIIHYGSKQVLFEGFLVQDDCSETLVDYTHEINLSANDNLGLLKDVSLDRANIFSVSYTSGTLPMAADFNIRQFLFGVSVNANIGDRIRISGTGVIDGDYTINKIISVPVGGGITTGIWFDEPIADNYHGNAVYSILTPANLLDKTPLSTILRMCLSVTGLQLPVHIYTKIMEVSQDASKSFFEQTLVDPQTFLKDDTNYTDCYDVLTKILSRFNMTLFQAEGVWNIVRWDELRYYNNRLQGFVYDSDFNYVGVLTKDVPIISGPDEDVYPETGILQKICRPFLFDKETFNYKYPPLIRNADLKQLGSLIKTYTQQVWVKGGVSYLTDPGGAGVISSFQTINEYQATWWTKEGMVPAFEPGNYFIRVTLDNIGNELSRVLVVNGYCRSYPIEVNAGDSFSYSFSFQTQDSQPGVVGLVFIVELNDGTTKKYFHNPDLTNGGQMWQTGTGFVYQVLSGDNSNQWHTVTVDSHYFPIPYDGLLYFYLTVADLNGTIRETYYKDITFRYTARINESILITGQTHQTSQAGVIKNTEDLEINIDDSPRNSISGTLFLNEKVGLLQKRTSLWKHPVPNKQKRLGDLITYDQLFWRNKPRSILEGTLYGAIQNGSYISLLSVLKYNQFPKLNFVWGQLEIDYKNNKATGTLWEIWEDDERDTDVAFGYAFNYLYSTDQ